MVKKVYKKRNFRLNAPSFKKGIMIQQTQRNPIINSSITVLRRTKPRQQQSIVTVKGNVTSVKLPTIVKKTPPKSKIGYVKY
jgi:hypothetical protein